MTEHTPETPEQEEPTADQRRAQLPGLGYAGKFDHGPASLEDAADDVEQATETPSDVPESPEEETEDRSEHGSESSEAEGSTAASASPPPPSATPWHLSGGQ